jgi:hypothetical protein
MSEVIKLDDIIFKPSSLHLVTKTTDEGTRIIGSKLVSEDRMINYKDFTGKLVCKDCNEGWMSLLELDVKPTLTVLQNGNFEIVIEPATAYRLSLWAIIKLIMITQTFKEKYDFPRLMFDLLYKQIIPEGFIVEIAKMKTHFMNFTVGPTIHPYAKQITGEDMEHVFDGFFVGALHLGVVGLRVSFLKTAQPVTRMQLDDPLSILFPYQSKLPIFYTPAEIWNTEVDKAGEVRTLCDSITIADSIRP